MTAEQSNPPDWVFEIAGATDRGLVRCSNEDSYVVLQGAAVPPWCSAVAAVFDGVGGQDNGQEASARAARYLPELLKAASWQQGAHRDPGKVVEELVQALHSRLRADQQEETALLRMATTGTVALLDRASSAVLWVGHVGDSPLFRFRAGSIEKLVMEDSLVAELLRDGLIRPEQAQRHPQRHVITQALGHCEVVTPHVSSHKVHPGDCYLLCTDGLTAMLPETRILEIVTAAESPQIACRDLIAAANAAGGTDNITIVIMKF